MDEREIRERLQKATPGPWLYSTFTKPDGSDIKTVEDVAETTSYSAMCGPRAELWGISLTELDDEGRVIVVGYTGNGPNSPNNADFIANAPTDIQYLLSLLDAERKRVQELQKELGKPEYYWRRRYKEIACVDIFQKQRVQELKGALRRVLGQYRCFVSTDDFIAAATIAEAESLLNKEQK